MIVNIKKTKIVVFKRGGRIAKHEKWFLNGEIIETENSFTYVGVHFTNRLSLYKMADFMSIKGKKVLMHILGSLSNLPYVPYKTFFKVFDMKVSPILLYGSELWGLKTINSIENVQIYACKRFLNVKSSACNDAVLGDTGRLPLQIFSAKRCIKYWLRILNMPKDRLVRLSYDMLLYFDNVGHTNWVTHVRSDLCMNGFAYIWNNQNVENPSFFLKTYVNRLINQHQQSWTASC